jgi:hypothetical protein
MAVSIAAGVWFRLEPAIAPFYEARDLASAAWAAASRAIGTRNGEHET